MAEKRMTETAQRKIEGLEARLKEAEEALGVARGLLRKDREGRETEVFLAALGCGGGEDLPLPPRSVVRFVFPCLWAEKDDNGHRVASQIDVSMYDDSLGGPTLRISSNFDEIMVTPGAANLVYVRPSGQFLGRDYVLFHRRTPIGKARADRTIKKLTKTEDR